MATSGVYTLSVSRNQIVTLAMQCIGKLGEGEAPTAGEVSDCALFLNMLVKQWQGKADYAPGLKTWARKHGHLFLSASTGQYTLGPSATGWTNSHQQTTTTAAAASGQAVVACTSVTGMTAGDRFGVVLTTGALFWGTISSIASLNVTLTSNLTGNVASGATVFTYTTAAQQPVALESAFLRDVNNSDTPLHIIQDHAEYDVLPSKNDTRFAGDPTAVYLETGLGSSTLYTDCAKANDVTKHIGLTYMEPMQVFSSASDTPYYPEEWYLALAWGLGRQIAPMFNAEWTQLMESNAVTALAIAQRKEPEIVRDYFQPGDD